MESLAGVLAVPHVINMTAAPGHPRPRRSQRRENTTPRDRHRGGGEILSRQAGGVAEAYAGREMVALREMFGVNWTMQCAAREVHRT